MAEKKTEKTPFQSAYGAGYIRADQWVTEKLCALMSKKSGSELPDKFWNLAKWKSIFRRQVQLASSLLILYDAEAISMALRDKRSYNIRSFAAFNSVPFFAKILDECQAEVDNRNSAEEIKLTPKSTTELPRLHKKENKLSRLKNIDGETRPVQSG